MTRKQNDCAGKENDMRKLTQEDVDFLAALQEELNTQDTVCQADPRFWVVRDSSWEPCWDGVAERFAVYNDGENVGELKSYVRFEDGDTTSIPERKVNKNRENTFFMTLRECREHIAANDYHYHGDAHPFAMTAWRSPQVEKLWKILQEVDWSELRGERETE